MSVKFFPIAFFENEEQSRYLQDYVNSGRQAVEKYIPVAQTIKQEHGKLAPHLKRLNVLYNNLDPNTVRKLGTSAGVLTGTATAVGLGLRLNRSTLDEFIEED